MDLIRFALTPLRSKFVMQRKHSFDYELSQDRNVIADCVDHVTNLVMYQAVLNMNI
jgi:hypothetical protein